MLSWMALSRFVGKPKIESERARERSIFSCQDNQRNGCGKQQNPHCQKLPPPRLHATVKMQLTFCSNSINTLPTFYPMAKISFYQIFSSSHSSCLLFAFYYPTRANGPRPCARPREVCLFGFTHACTCGSPAGRGLHLG